MTVDFTDRNPSYDTNRELLKDMLKEKQQYPITYFDDFSSGVRIGGEEGKKYKLKLIDDKLDIENVTIINLRACEWHWDWEDKRLTLILNQSDFSVDIFF